MSRCNNNVHDFHFLLLLGHLIIMNAAVCITRGYLSHNIKQAMSYHMKFSHDMYVMTITASLVQRGHIAIAKGTIWTYCQCIYLGLQWWQ